MFGSVWVRLTDYKFGSVRIRNNILTTFGPSLIRHRKIEFDPSLVRILNRFRRNCARVPHRVARIHGSAGTSRVAMHNDENAVGPSTKILFVISEDVGKDYLQGFDLQIYKMGFIESGLRQRGR